MNRFDLDASIMFPDILVIPESLGMKFELVPKVGPVFKTSISSSRDIEKLNFNHSYFKIYNGINIIRKSSIKPNFDWICRYSLDNCLLYG